MPGLFECFGVELEYMIVSSQTLDVLPIADELLKAAAGEYVSDVERGEVAWSNELALHVIELKTNGPAKSLPPLVDQFADNVRQVETLLQPLGGKLLPTAMHPWMDPEREMRLWPHEYSAIYEAFNNVFDCRGHGWANLQSVHLNLPFSGDDEFGRLHAAIRLLLPILPALAASSPLLDQRISGLMDTRMEVYRGNARRVPNVSAKIIPEPAYTQADYQRLILDPLYAAIAPLDPQGILQDEFLNARGAIARFSRGSIEIRVLDVQECPLADIAICAAAVGVLEQLVSERWSPTAQQQSLEVEPLYNLLLSVIREGDQAVVDDLAYLRQFGLERSLKAGELWQHLAESFDLGDARFESALRTILQKGPLSRRILRHLNGEISHSGLIRLYSQLAECLTENRQMA